MSTEVQATTAIDARLRLLIGQLDGAWDMFQRRIAGLTDDEYFWEPAPGCWSLRRREDAAAPMSVGKGEWVLERELPPPSPAPFTTIAWRMCHLSLSPLMRYDYTFGGHSLTIETITWPATAAGAIEFVTDAHQTWRRALEDVSPADLDMIGRSRFPHGLDPQVRFDDLVAWVNTEFTHHAAEIACLRDLYRLASERTAHAWT
jgi:hypothetical protein